MFGAAATSQPQQSGGLFGNLNTQPAQQQTGGLFGQSQPQQQIGGLFGGSLAQNQGQQQQQQSGGGLFAGLGQSTQNQQKPTMFGSTMNQPQPTSSLFGGSTVAPPQQQSSGPFGGSLGARLQFGQSRNQQHTVPGVQVDVSQIRGTTRFQDLNEQVQSEIIQLETFIQQQIAAKDQCSALMPKHGEGVSYIPNDVKFCADKLDTVTSALDFDANAVDQLRKTVQSDTDDAMLSFKAIDNLKLPQQFHYTGMAWPSSVGGGSSKSAAAIEEASKLGGSGSDGNQGDIVSYFSKRADALAAEVARYERQLAEVEEHLRTVEAGAAQSQEELIRRMNAPNGEHGLRSQERELRDVFNAIESEIYTVATKVGQAREAVIDVTVGSAASTLR